MAEKRIYALETLTAEESAMLNASQLTVIEALKSAGSDEKTISAYIEGILRSAKKQAKEDARNARRLEKAQKFESENLYYTIAAESEDDEDEKDALGSFKVYRSSEYGTAITIGRGTDDNALPMLRSIDTKGKTMTLRKLLTSVGLTELRDSLKHTELDKRVDYEFILTSKSVKRSKAMLVANNKSFTGAWIVASVVQRGFGLTLAGIAEFVLGLKKQDGTPKYQLVELDSLKTLADDGDKSAKAKYTKGVKLLTAKSL